MTGTMFSSFTFHVYATEKEIFILPFESSIEDKISINKAFCLLLATLVLCCQSYLNSPDNLEVLEFICHSILSYNSVHINFRSRLHQNDS